MSTPSAGEGVAVTSAGAGVAVVWLDRPDTRNALDRADWIAFGDVVAGIGRDSAVGAVVIAGRNGAFCAGVNMKSLPPLDDEVTGSTQTLVEINATIGRLRNLGRPVLSAVERFAFGPGLSIAVASDVVVAAANAYFAAPRVSAGMLPDTAVAYSLVRVLGYHRAFAVACLGERLDAATAARAGLVHQLTEPGATIPVAIRLAQDLAALPRDAIVLAKQLLRAAEPSGFDAASAAETSAVALNKLSASSTAARLSYFARRRPD